MSDRRQFDQQYSSFFGKLGNFMRYNSGFPISAVARAGSRRGVNYNNDSDLDVIFTIGRDPSKEEVYPVLVDRLNSDFNVEAQIGSSYNVIKIRKDSLNIDLILLNERQFRRQLESYNYREI